MAMNGNTLGQAVWTAVKAQQTFSPSISPADDAKGLALWQAIMAQVVSHIQSNAQASVNTTGADPQGGTVTSSGTGTIS